VFVVGCIGDDWRSAAEVLFESESLRWNSEKGRKERQRNAKVTTNRLVAFGEYSDDGTASTIKCRDYKDATDLIVYENDLMTSTFKVRNGCEGGGKGYLGQQEKAFTISAIQDQNLYHNNIVRRLTPMECERLQGFPDNYTNIPTSSDTTRYKALGNSMAVPVMRWIGNRINNV
jgi:DNA (cytosine-5)-methyltransferase 1